MQGTCRGAHGKCFCLLRVEMASLALPSLFLAAPERLLGSCSMSVTFWAPSLAVPFSAQLLLHT